MGGYLEFDKYFMFFYRQIQIHIVLSCISCSWVLDHPVQGSRIYRHDWSGNQEDEAEREQLRVFGSRIKAVGSRVQIQRQENREFIVDVLFFPAGCKLDEQVMQCQRSF